MELCHEPIPPSSPALACECELEEPQRRLVLGGFGGENEHREWGVPVIFDPVVSWGLHENPCSEQLQEKVQAIKV